MFEIHITVGPPQTESQLATLRKIADRHGFRVSKFLMLQSEQKDVPDAFITGHDATTFEATASLVDAIRHLHLEGFQVLRYKIEDVILDSRKADVLNLL